MKKIFATLLLSSAGLLADPVSVTYTATGSPGTWLLDFTVTTNLVPSLLNPGNPFEVFQWAVDLDPVWDTVTEAHPANWAFTGITNPSNAPAGYLGWISFSPNIPNPGSLGGFQLGITSATLPTSVNFWALAHNSELDDYPGPADFYQGSYQPGFIGAANLVPEIDPGSLSGGLAFLSGLFLIARGRRNRQNVPEGN